MRLDKWLWAARFFKTRSLASEACQLGRIECNGQQAKASREVRIGDMLRIRNNSGVFLIEVLLLSEVRGPGAVAQALYRETEASGEARRTEAEARRMMPDLDPFRDSRPSKRDRRELHRLRGRY